MTRSSSLLKNLSKVDARDFPIATMTAAALCGFDRVYRLAMSNFRRTDPSIGPL
jgi:hypothetical protein